MAFISSVFHSASGFIAALAVFLAVGMALGYALRGRGNKKRMGKGEVAVSSAFLKGLNYLISNNQDKAIEEFTRAVKVDSDTIETYVALGNLFRSKGEIERAIRIRQSIIVRHGVDEEIKRQALYDLGIDYRKGGIIDRAIASFDQLIRLDPSRLDVYEQLEQLYNETRDWGKCYQSRQKIAKLKGTHDRNILAHYQTELGKVHFENGQFKNAEDCFKKAISLDKSCVDAYLHMADLYLKTGNFSGALGNLRNMSRVAPEMSYLAFDRLEKLDLDEKDEQKVEKFIQECIRGHETTYAHLALARYRLKNGRKIEALDELKKAVEINPGFLPARKAMGRILLEQDSEQEIKFQYQELLELLDSSQEEYQCSHCGYTSSHLTWKCPQCNLWDTIKHVETEKQSRSS